MSSRFTAGETYLFGGAVRSPIGRYARFEPFVTAGAGVAIHTTGSQLVTLPAPAADMGVTRLTRDTLTSPYFTAGAGTRFAAGDNWGMRLDFRPRYLLPELSPSGGAWFFDWTFGPYLSF